MLKHNAVVAEWINSPIRYLPDDENVARLNDLADRHFDPRGYALHYASLGRNNLERWDPAAETIPAKRYFYALRPALSVRALRLDPRRRPPMRLQDLIAVCDLTQALSSEILHLVELKSAAREVTGTRRSLAIEKLVVEELDRASEVPSKRSDPDFLKEADALFQHLVATELQA